MFDVEPGKKTLRRTASSGHAPTRIPPAVQDVLRSPGRPLDEPAKTYMEARFGHDFSQVRVHADARAAESAQAVSALAYTVGRDVVFGEGRYAPDTTEGRRLLAHELTHTIQQDSGRQRKADALEITHPGAAAELEARNASNVLARGKCFVPTVAGGVSIARDVPDAGVPTSEIRDAGASDISGVPTPPPAQTAPPPAQTAPPVATLAPRRQAPARLGRGPNVVANGYHSFYVRAMVPGNRTEVRVQFYQNPAGTGGATFSVWYQETGTTRQVSFTPTGAIAPRILDEDVGIVTFDLNSDNVPDIFLTALPSAASGGIDFSATRNGGAFFTMAARPAASPKYVAGRGYYVGQLPNGRPYYMVPGSRLPGGPRFVDDRGQLVNPALEAQGAAINRVFGTVLVGSMALSALVAGAFLVASAGTTAGGVAVLRFLFTGPRLVSGGVSAGANLITQAMQYGTDLSRYNWPSVGLDYVIGAISNEVAHGLFRRWPAPIFTRPLSRTTWTNFARQQSIFLLYGTLVGLIRAQVANTQSGSTVASQHTEGVAQAVKSGAMQSFLSSAFGQQQFPAGLRDPRIIAISKVLDLVIKVAIREVYGVTPSQQATPSGAQSAP